MMQRAARFVGREAERERLGTLAAIVAGGGSEALVVAGPAGVGKSALLDRLADEAGDVTVLRAAGAQAESDLPFAALDALLRPVLEYRSDLPAVQVDALERALALAPGEPPDQFAVAAATLSLLGAAAEELPVLCLVDDAHWVDSSSLKVLAFAARRLGSESIGIVVAARADRLPSELRGIETIAVGGLDDAQARELLVATAGERLPGELADQLVAAADGNPLVLLELVGRLNPAQREGREAVIGPPPPHARAEDLLGERIAALPPATRDALLVAATAGDGDVALIQRALASSSPLAAEGARAGDRAEGSVPGGSASGAAVHRPAAVGDLTAAEAAGLVELRAGRLHFDHPLVASVAYHDATPERRRWAHAAVAAGLSDGDGRRPWHLAGAAAGPDEDVAAQLDALSDQARARGGYSTAGRASLRAADLSPDPEDRARRLLVAADALEFAGQGEEAVTVIAQAESLTCEPTTAARIRGMQGHYLLTQGQIAAAEEDLRRAVEVLAPAEPVQAARFALEGGWANMLLGDVGAWVERTGLALSLLAGDDGSPTHRVALALHGAALVGAGRADEADPLLHRVETDLLRLARAREPITGAVEAYGVLVQALVWLERWITADRLLAALVEDARALGAAGALPWLLSVRATLDLRLGRWDSASATSDEAVRIGDAAGQLAYRTSGLGVRAVTAALRGDAAAARADADAVAAAGSAPLLVVESHVARGIVALGEGDVATAATELREAARITDEAGFREPGSRPFEPDLIEALIRNGELAEATARLDAWEDLGIATNRAFALVTAARLRALLAEDEAVDAQFQHALALHDDLPMPYERARTLFAYGERLRRARRRADARPPLREALETFDQLPAPAWAAKARHELRTTGGMVPPRERPGSTELTAHELQVALMVAEGRTNREVAAALFLAPKTIEHHLSTIFRKLGIRRRTELAHALAGSGHT